MISSSTNRRLGIVLQYGQMALNIIISLIYTPIMLRILGDAEYGIYNLASSIISYLSLLSLGFGAGYIRFYSRYKAQNDEQGIKTLNGLYLIVFLFIGLIALIAGLFMAFNVSIFFNETYTQQNLETAKILMIFLAFNLAVSFPSSVFVSYITSQEKFVFQKIVNMGKTILSPCLCIAVLFLGYGSIGMVIVTTILSLIVDMINVCYCISKLKMRFSISRPNFALLKEIFIFSVFIAINQIIDQLNWQTDKIILGKMINASAVAVYAVAANINTMYLSLSTAISSVFTPQIHEIVNDNNRTEEQKNIELTRLFSKVGRIQFLVLGLILTGFVFFGQYFISKWAGPGYEDAYYVVLLLICPATISLCQNTGIEIQRAKNKHQMRSIAYLIMAIINVCISIWFVSLWGVIGAAFGTTISIIVGPILFMNIYYQLKLNINVILFWKSILKIIPGFIIPIAIGVCFMLFYSFKGIWDFILVIVAYAIVYCLSMFFLGCNKEEKNLIKSLLYKFVPNKEKHYK